MCTLRAAGAEFDVDAFLAESPLRPEAVFHAGDPTLECGPPRRGSGFNLGVSDASWSDLAAQVRESEGFLARHKEELARLVRYPGVTGVSLDFPVDQRIGTGAMSQLASFPPSLVTAAGALGIGLELSIYPRRDD